MKKSTLFSTILILGVIFLLLYLYSEMKKEDVKFNEITKELRIKTETIEEYRARSLILARDKEISENRLNVSREEIKSLRIELEKKPKIKIEYRDKIIEVIKFEKLEDCQFDLKLCMEKSKSLEDTITEYLDKNDKLELNNQKLNHEMSGKLILLENERENYKKLKRKTNLQKIGIVIFGTILFMVTK